MKKLSLLVLVCFFVSGLVGPSWGISSEERLKKLAAEYKESREFAVRVGKITGPICLVVGLVYLLDAFNNYGSPQAIPPLIFSSMGLLSGLVIIGSVNKMSVTPEPIEQDYETLLEMENSNLDPIKRESFVLESLSTRSKNEEKNRLLATGIFSLLGIAGMTGNSPTLGLLNFGIAGYLYFNKFGIEREYEDYLRQKYSLIK